MNSPRAKTRSSLGALLGKLLGFIFLAAFLVLWLVHGVESWHRRDFFAAAFFVVPPIFFALLGIRRIRNAISALGSRLRGVQTSLSVQVAPTVQTGGNPVSDSGEVGAFDRLTILPFALFLVFFAFLWDRVIFLDLVPDVLRSWRQPNWTLNAILSIPFLFGTLVVNSLAIGFCILLFSPRRTWREIRQWRLSRVSRDHENVSVNPQSVTESSASHLASPGYGASYGGGAWEREPLASGVQNATSGPPNPPPGYTAKLLSHGAAVELLPPRSLAIGRWIILIFLVPWTIVWNTASITCLLTILGVTKGCDVEHNSVWGVAVGTLIGLAVAVIVLNVMFVRRHWIVSRGRMAHRTSIRVLRLAWDRIHHEVVAFEIRHAVWDTGRGYVDSLWFRTTGSAKKIRVDVESDPGAGSYDGVSIAPRKRGDIGRRIAERYEELAKKREELGMDPGIVAMGRYLADRTGTKLEVVTEVVPEPSGD